MAPGWLVAGFEAVDKFKLGLKARIWLAGTNLPAPTDASDNRKLDCIDLFARLRGSILPVPTDAADNRNLNCFDI
jgi:hypothetical protein